MINKHLYLIKVIPKLGLLNVCRVLFHRIKIRFYSFFSSFPKDNYFSNTEEFFLVNVKPKKIFSDEKKEEILREANNIISGYISMFGKPPIFVGNPPDWSSQCIEKKFWAKIAYNQVEGVDVKEKWELSRFYWAPVLAAAYSCTKNTVYLDVLNNWVKDWCEKNPYNHSINWVCGQEVAIRVINLLTASLIIGQSAPSRLLLRFVQDHCSRVFATIGYSIAQDNNHGSSEAAALYIAGAWLKSTTELNSKKNEKYHFVGKKWLENRSGRLIQADGSSVQFSTNYHRVIIDTYSLVEVWRRNLTLPLLSKDLYTSLSKATNWLFQVTQQENGFAPNFGANDGSNLLPIHGSSHMDYRPSIQLASVLFNNKCAYSGSGSWNIHAWLFEYKFPSGLLSPPSSQYFPMGGYSLLRVKGIFVFFNIPVFRFRPSQSDALHLDLWVNGRNFLKDAGSYSYNAKYETSRYFGGVESHNTIQFDDRDQMPRLGRFLFAEWLKGDKISAITYDGTYYSSSASYKDYLGAVHHRKIKLSNSSLIIVDSVDGFNKKSVLRWRLTSGSWVVDHENQQVFCNNFCITVTSTSVIKRFAIVEGEESLSYLEKKKVQVLEVEIHQPGSLMTHIGI